MARQQIECTVSSCFYWGDGDRCHAERIIVTGNPAGIRNARTEFGQLEGRDAAHSSETQCHTFVPRQQGPKPGIRRLDEV
ncbi:DUF1540 domain-containing protein [Caldinitratiruptor microaerophilus]|uniref:DUF1540 domain-containing protein n=1 Tax=Caldinitratiruptor microaerophilus TaxID=671077 RepID=A0AA35CLE4_9FIRM|nr:DUF1540 domain-containing protein [Caldinitratiruptor microaerophilus]BDG61470.1 hypothetical protein caldi_25600 [Caldinitratiruptor microaerophilus]